MDYTTVFGGLPFNMNFMPTVLSTDDSLHKLQSLIHTFSKLGGMQIRIDFVDKETLLEAQRYRFNRICGVL